MSKGAQTRGRILAAARRLLEAGAPASMGTIAKEAGVTRQLLYHHFAGRADLLLELSRAVDRDARTRDHQKLLDDAADARTALREAVALQGHIKPRIQAVAAAVDQLRRTDPDAAAAWREREDARFRRCLEVARRLEEERLLAPGWTVPVAARLIWSTTSQRAWHDLVSEGNWSTQHWIDHTTRLLERALVLTDGPV